MSIDLKLPDLTELRPRITVMGVGGAGGNAVNNMIASGLEGVEFIAANTDAQALSMSGAAMRVQMGVTLTEGLGAGSKPDVGAAAAEEALDEIRSLITGAHMLFVTAGMGGGTGTGAAPVIAKAAREMGILTVGVITKPFEFEGQRRMRVATEGIKALNAHVDTLIVIPNQNLFRVATEQTTFADAFQKADDVLKSGVACITDLMVKDGLINLDFADVRVVMQNMGTALMGTGQAGGENRAYRAAEIAILNPLLDEMSMKGAKGLLISIVGNRDLTLFEVQEAASRIRREVDPESNPDLNIIMGAAYDHSLQGEIRVSVVATGINEGQLPPAATSHEPDRSGLVGRLYGGGQRQGVQERAEPPRQPLRGDVAIEPRARRAAPGAGERMPPPPAPGQLEVPSGGPIRAPRRPLSGVDFAELANEPRAGDSEPRRSGFLGWRKRGADADTPAGNAPRPQSRAPHGQPDEPRRGHGTRPARGADDELDFPTFLNKR